MKGISMEAASGEDRAKMQKALDWVQQNRSNHHTALEFERRAIAIGYKEEASDRSRYMNSLIQAGLKTPSQDMPVTIQIASGRSYWQYNLNVKGDKVEFAGEYEKKPSKSTGG